MESGLLDNQKKAEILRNAGSGLLQRLDVNSQLKEYLVKARVINPLDSEDMEQQSPSQRRNNILHRLRAASILQFICFCLIVYDWCDQPHIVDDVFKLNIEHLRTQKDQIDAKRGTPTDQFPPTRPPQQTAERHDSTHSYAAQPQTYHSPPLTSYYPGAQSPFTLHPAPVPESSTLSHDTMYLQQHQGQPLQHPPQYQQHQHQQQQQARYWQYQQQQHHPPLQHPPQLVQQQQQQHHPQLQHPPQLVQQQQQQHHPQLQHPPQLVQQQQQQQHHPQLQHPPQLVQQQQQQQHHPQLQHPPQLVQQQQHHPQQQHQPQLVQQQQQQQQHHPQLQHPPQLVQQQQQHHPQLQHPPQLVQQQQHHPQLQHPPQLVQQQQQQHHPQLQHPPQLVQQQQQQHHPQLQHPPQLVQQQQQHHPPLQHPPQLVQQQQQQHHPQLQHPPQLVQQQQQQHHPQLQHPPQLVQQQQQQHHPQLQHPPQLVQQQQQQQLWQQQSFYHYSGYPTMSPTYGRTVPQNAACNLPHPCTSYGGAQPAVMTQQPQPQQSATGSFQRQTSAHQHDHNPPPAKRRKSKDEDANNKDTHYFTFNLEDDFDAGGSDPESPERGAFVAKVQHGLLVTLKEYTGKILDVVIMCVSQLKQLVLVRVDCHAGLTEEIISDALLSPNNELTKSSLCITGTLRFKDYISALLIKGIIFRGHKEDPCGRRINFDTNYVRLKMLSPKSLAAVSRDELERPDRYQQALQQSTREDIIDEDIVKPNDLEKYILVRGRAGIGKSTLVQRLMWRWAHGEWAVQFKAIFILSIRHLMAMKPSIDFPQLLNLIAVGQHSIKISTQWLQENQHQLIFVLDGIDEVQNFRVKWEKSLKPELSALSWAFALMKRLCLPKATLIVTSRPFSDLFCIKPTTLVEVMGLTKERVMEFVQKNVEPTHIKMVKETLENQPILLSVSSITFYCAALCQVLQDDIGVRDKLMTYTQITAYIIERFIDHSVKGSKSVADFSSSLKAMTKLAYDGIMKSGRDGLAQLMFNEADLDRQKITGDQVKGARQSGIFMQTEVPSMDPSGKKEILGEFIHLSVQELFAMVELLSQSQVEVKAALEKMSSSGQFNMALLFLYGFAFNRKSEAINRLCTTMGVNCDVPEDICQILKKNIKSGGDMLQVLQVVHESQSPEMAKIVGESRFKDEIKLRYMKMTVVDILALIFLLKNHPATNCIVLEQVGLDTVSMKELMHYFKYNTTITSLRLIDKGLDGQSLSLLTDAFRINETCAIKQLRLAVPRGDERELISLAALLVQRCPFTTLVIGSGLPTLHLDTQGAQTKLRIMCPQLQDDDMKSLCAALTHNCTLQELEMWCTNVTAAGWTCLWDVLKVNKTLIKLTIYRDGLQDDDMKSLCAALTHNCTLQELGVMCENVTAAGWTCLWDYLKVNKTLIKLHIGSEKLEYVGMKALCAALTHNSTLQKLKLYGTTLTDESAADLVDLLSVNNTVAVEVYEAQCSPHVQQQLNDNPRIQVNHW